MPQPAGGIMPQPTGGIMLQPAGSTMPQPTGSTMLQPASSTMPQPTGGRYGASLSVFNNTFEGHPAIYNLLFTTCLSDVPRVNISRWGLPLVCSFDIYAIHLVVISIKPKYRV